MNTFKILLALAEEDPHSFTVIQSTLGKKGYEVTAEATGEPETGRISLSNFDLVITDRLAVLDKAKELNAKIMAILVLEMSSRSIPTVRAIRSSRRKRGNTH